MNALSRRLAACLIGGLACFVVLAPSTAGAATQPRLTYYGGHVLSHVKVDVVVWGSWSYGRTVPLTGTHSISSFFAGITASKYLDWLNEYDTPTQHIKRGSLEGVYTVHPPSASDGPTVSEAQIGTALHALIDAGQLPKPSTNRLYAIFFRSGQTIVTRDGNSSSDFCAYHDTMAYKSSTAYFAVMPYELRSRGCKPGHELVRQRHHHRVPRAHRSHHRSRCRPEPARLVRREQRRGRRHLRPDLDARSGCRR